MLSLSQIEADLTAAMKAKNQVAVDTLRGLKVRIQNEQIAKTRPELAEEEIVALIRSEIKRRKEAAAAFTSGGREESAGKELAEAGILERYLPAQLTEAQVLEVVEKTIAEHNFTAKDFGQAMAALKAATSNGADGAMLARLLKEKLK